MEFDFSGWATRANLRCSDGRTILPDAFKHMDGMEVPLVWNHQHNDVNEILGKALLEHRDGEGMYTYCKFNETESGKTAKLLVQHGDICALSICANNLKQQMSNVLHGNIREVSLVLAGANPGAYIENVIKHGEEMNEEAIIFTGDEISLYHADEGGEESSKEDSKTDENSASEKTLEEVYESLTDEQKEAVHAMIGEAVELASAIDDAGDDEKNDGGEDKNLEHSDEEGKTVEEVIDSMSEEQQAVLYALVNDAREGVYDADTTDNEGNNEEKEEIKHSEGGDESMKKNLFSDGEEMQQGGVLQHADQEAIVALAKQSNVGSLKLAMQVFAEENKDTLKHGIFENYEELFPEYELLKKGEPETLERDQSWIAAALAKIHKSPISRIRTRHADARVAELKAKGYQKKGDKKTEMAKITMINRTTDPQTIYIKDDMHRDDIIDITDFDVVAYQWKMMRHIMDETLALAALIGDGREDDDPDKIHETHIRSIWNDDEIYTMHHDVDIEAMRETLQGTNTGANFGENFIYAEAIITKALYAREQYKGTGTPDLYCTPHMVNVMLLARDLNGRRIYESVSDLAKALNVGAIHTVEQFEGRTRTTKEGDVKKLLGLFVNLADYQFGATKGGQITRFDDFDMDFNKYKYMLETRLSGSLVKLYSAIALEEPVEETTAG